MATGAKHSTLHSTLGRASPTPHSLLAFRDNYHFSSVTMRLTGSRAYARPAPTPTMPPGLVELMEGLAKDVLKHNPENVYEFCAAHMQTLIEIRDGPAQSMKQLSLEQKIAKAQEKLRQRNKNRQLQLDRKLSEHSKLDHEAKQLIEENIVDALAIQPFIHKEKLIKKNEVEIFHEPSVIIATNETCTDEPPHVVNEDIEAPQVEHESEASISNATQKVETRKSPEKVIEEANENLISVDTNETSDVEAIFKSGNVADVEEQSEFIVDRRDQDIQSTDHVEIILTHEGELDTPSNEREPIVSDTSDNVDAKTDLSLISENPEKAVAKDELNEVASSVLLVNKTIAALTHVSDVKLGEVEVEEPIIVKKEEKTDTLHEEIFLQNISNQIETDKKIDHVADEQKVTFASKHTDTDIQHEQKDVDNIENKKECIEGSTHAENEHIVKENHENAPKPPNSLDSTVEEFSINHLETPQQTETSHDKNTDLSSTETKKAISQDSTEGADLFQHQIITVETKERLSKDDSFKGDYSGAHDVQHEQVNHEPQADIELTEIDNKLPEQARAHSEELVVKDNANILDQTAIAEKRDSITGSDELSEHTAGSGMDLETAAITIQKVFRTFLFSKSRASTLDDTVNENSLDEDIEKKDEPEYALLTSANINKERRTLGISRMDTVLQTVNEEKSLSLSDDSSLSSAATTIQAHVRGFLVRNRLASNKTASSSSLVNSDGPSTSLDDVNEPKKTILNIHIVPERGQFMSRDESLLTSIDLPLDNSPPSSINLHPLGYDKSERRKQLKREDAIQSISPPSNNSGKLSEEVDSVKETLNVSEDADVKPEQELVSVNDHDKPHEADTESCDTTLTISSTAETVIDADTYNPREILSSPEHNVETDNKNNEVTSSDEMDVITPSTISVKSASIDTENDDKPKLVHSGEFHDMVVLTQVKRSEASVVREFKNVLVYFLVWDKT